MGVISEGNVLAAETLPSDSHAGLTPLLPKLEPIVCTWREQYDVSAVGIAFPSLVDVDHKKIIGQSGKFDDFAQVDLERWVTEKFRLPMVLENDANAAALGEHAYGAAKGCGDFVLMILGTGIGTAAFMNGSLLRGRHYQAGNIMGHVPLKVHGRKCRGCPGEGCAEAQASTWALKYMVRESELDSPLKSEEKVDFKILKKYYDMGDPLAGSVFDECCDYWANTLLSQVCAYDPELVVLSGGVFNWGPELADRLTREVRRRAWTPWGKLRFAVAGDPEASVLLGLYALAETAY